MENKNHKVGTKYKSRNGMIGTIEDVRGVKRLVVRNAMGRVVQTINPENIDLSQFEVIDG